MVAAGFESPMRASPRGSRCPWPLLQPAAKRIQVAAAALFSPGGRAPWRVASVVLSARAARPSGLHRLYGADGPWNSPPPVSELYPGSFRVQTRPIDINSDWTALKFKRLFTNWFNF
ncbi:hypothetical protein Cni_G04594 [Canna indica]|uniref:Uncharacterized protein n=1 Tax=Canna indica TaxID=4628 RepID=A0AAQ3Q4L7_9LILI|nr:hypothetical protein Cni_G04594 [Canna indica]